MSEAKTRPTGEAVAAFLDRAAGPARADCETLIGLMREVTGEEPAMWGPAIVGFGSYHYRYATGREGDSPLASFSPRKKTLAIYLSYGFERHADLLARIPNQAPESGKACLHLRHLGGVDLAALRELIARSVAWARETYPQA